MSRLYSLVLFAMCVIFAHKVSGQTPYSSCFASRSTWFADNQHGACMYGPSLGPTGNGNFFICASSMLVFDNSADCGACYQITGPNGTSVIVTVVDQCTDGGVCNTNFPHLDLSPQAFDTLADPSVAGVVNTNVQRVACPVQGGVKLRVGSNFFSSTSWEVLIFNHRLPITQVTVTSAGQTTPISLPRQTYNYWRYDGPALTSPVTISVTDVLGDVASFDPLTLSSGLIAESSQQFNAPYPSYPGSSEAGCPAPPPVPVAMGGWIYQNGLAKQYTDTDVSYINVFQWTDWSYGATINWASTVNPYPGSTTCAQATLSSPGAIQIGQATSFSWSQYFSSLQFAIRGDSAYNGITVFWKGSPVQVPIQVTTEWQLITLSLGDQLQTPAQIGGQVVLSFQNTLSGSSPNIYLDNIRLVPISGSSSSSASSSVSSPTSTSTSTSTASSSTSTSTSTSTSASSSSSSSSSVSTSTSAAVSSSSSDATSTSTATSASSSSSSSSSSSAASSATSTSTSTSGTPGGVNPGTPTSPQCSVSLSQAITGSWADSTTQYTQWGVNLRNTSPRTITSFALVPQSSQVPEITQFWCVEENTFGQFVLPSWVDQSGGVSAGATFPWGYISVGNSPVSFTVVNTTCQ